MVESIPSFFAQVQQGLDWSQPTSAWGHHVSHKASFDDPEFPSPYLQSPLLHVEVEAMHLGMGWPAPDSRLPGMTDVESSVVLDGGVVSDLVALEDAGCTASDSQVAAAAATAWTEQKKLLIQDVWLKSCIEQFLAQM